MSRWTARRSGSCARPGRYMPEYRALRAEHTPPRRCAARPSWPWRSRSSRCARWAWTRRSCFSDLLLPLAPLGVPFDFQAGEGPVVESPLRSAADIAPAAPLRAARGAGHGAGGDPARPAGARRAGAPDRLRGRALHARLLRDRRWPLRELRRHEGADVRGAPRPGTRWPRSSPTWSPTTCSRRWRPARRRCRSSTRGSARSTRRTTASSRCRTSGRSSSGCAAGACR